MESAPISSHTDTCLCGGRCTCDLGQDILPKLRALNPSTCLRSNDIRHADEIRSLTPACRVELQRYRVEIAKLYNLAYSLENEQEEMRNHLQSSNSLLSYIRRLPAEVLAQVMEQTDPEIQVVGGIVMLSGSLFVFRSVCRYWRDIVDTSPNLWRRIVVSKLTMPVAGLTQASGMQCSPLTALDMLAMSKNQGLSVKFYSREINWDSLQVKSFMTALFSHSNRFGTLTIVYNTQNDLRFMSFFQDVPSLSRLREVFIRGGAKQIATDSGGIAEPFSVLGKATAMRHLSIIDFCISRAFPDFPYGSLTSLFLTTGVSYASDLLALHSCPQLTKAVLRLRPRTKRDFDILNAETSSAVAPIILKNITNIHFFIEVWESDLGHYCALQKILGRLECPRLEIFRAAYSLEALPLHKNHTSRIPSAFPAEELIGFLRQSSCLQELHLDNLSFIESDVIKLFQVELACLHTLIISSTIELRDSLICDTLLQKLTIREKRTCGSSPVRSFPALTKLSIKGIEECQDSFLLDVVKSRWSKRATGLQMGVASLKKLSLYFPRKTIDKDMYAPLAHMVCNGLILELRDSSGWVDFEGL